METPQRNHEKTSTWGDIVSFNSKRKRLFWGIAIILLFITPVYFLLIENYKYCKISLSNFFENTQGERFKS